MFAHARRVSLSCLALLGALVISCSSPPVYVVAPAPPQPQGGLQQAPPPPVQQAPDVPVQAAPPARHPLPPLLQHRRRRSDLSAQAARHPAPNSSPCPVGTTSRSTNGRAR
jgi:hypothetical protein